MVPKDPGLNRVNSLSTSWNHDLMTSDNKIRFLLKFEKLQLLGRVMNASISNRAALVCNCFIQAATTDMMRLSTLRG